MSLCFVWLYRAAKVPVHPAAFHEAHLLGVQMESAHPLDRRQRLSYAPGTTPREVDDEDPESFPAAECKESEPSRGYQSPRMHSVGTASMAHCNAVSMMKHDELTGPPSARSFDGVRGVHKATMSMSFQPNPLNPSPHLTSPIHHGMFAPNVMGGPLGHSAVPIHIGNGAAIAPQRGGGGGHGRSGSRASKLSIANDEELKAVFDILNREGSVSARYVMENGSFYIENGSVANVCAVMVTFMRFILASNWCISAL